MGRPCKGTKARAGMIGLKGEGWEQDKMGRPEMEQGWADWGQEGTKDLACIIDMCHTFTSASLQTCITYRAGADLSYIAGAFSRTREQISPYLKETSSS